MRRTYNWGEIVFALFLGVYVTAVIVAALGYGPKARAVPLLAGVFTLVMIIIILASELIPRMKKKLHVGLMNIEKFDKKDEPSTDADYRELWKKIFGAAAWTLGVLFAIYLVGFHIAILLFSFFFFRFHGEVGWLKSLLLTVILYGSVYLFFHVLLSIDLYEGIFFGALPPSF